MTIESRIPTFADHQSIQRAATILENGAFVQKPELMIGARIKCLIVKSDLPAIPDNISILSPSVVLVIDTWLQRLMYPSLADTDFFQSWREWREKCSKDSPKTSP